MIIITTHVPGSPIYAKNTFLRILSAMPSSCLGVPSDNFSPASNSFHNVVAIPVGYFEKIPDRSATGPPLLSSVSANGRFGPHPRLSNCRPKNSHNVSRWLFPSIPNGNHDAIIAGKDNITWVKRVSVVLIFKSHPCVDCLLCRCTCWRRSECWLFRSRWLRLWRH
jgi:hypothetical protein